MTEKECRHGKPKTGVLHPQCETRQPWRHICKFDRLFKTHDKATHITIVKGIATKQEASVTVLVTRSERSKGHRDSNGAIGHYERGSWHRDSNGAFLRVLVLFHINKNKHLCA